MVLKRWCAVVYEDSLTVYIISHIDIKCKSLTQSKIRPESLILGTSGLNLPLVLVVLSYHYLPLVCSPFM